MAYKNNGGPAFPAVATFEDGLKSFNNQIHGMSLRDWFAGMALQGILASPNPHSFGTERGNTPKLVSEIAYIYAETMIDEREK